ncbi:MAG: imidazoleglycerol-phosphate dehydratase HisB [Candidatus Bathyarchaeota archaeon]
MREAEVKRITKETSVTVKLNLDEAGEIKIKTENAFLNHLLTSFALHAMLKLEVYAETYEKSKNHHLIEDVALTLGQALSKALGEKVGINRFGYAIVPMDEVLVLVSLDLSGRPYFKSNLKLKPENIEGLSSSMVNHFLRSFSYEGKFNLHVMVLRGGDDHHKVEAVFKALGLSLKEAVKIREKGKYNVPSTKGIC